MKKLQSTLLVGSAYTIFILIIFYLFAIIGQLTLPAITFPTFLVILVFGMIISFSENIFYIKSLKFTFKVMIHYALLLIAFCSIFIFSGNLKSEGPGAIFVAVVIFSFLYAAMFTLVYFIRKWIGRLDKKIENFNQKKAKEETKPKYKSLYKNDD